MTSTLAQLLIDRARSAPDLSIGVATDPLPLQAAVEAAARVAGALAEVGCTPGSRVAMVEQPDTSYLVFWMACQLAGIAPALVNPHYPTDLVGTMLDELDPRAVVTGTGRDVASGRMAIDLTGARRGEIVVDGTTLAGPAAASLPGVARDPLDVAGFMHTSGTTGPPKFCAQSHEYFLRLGRFVARALALTAEDTVLAPLPFFHINPLGYGFIGALTASASVVGLRRFVPETFWQTAKEVGATVLVLHAPPVQVLKARTEPASARGHRVRITFYADLDFLTRYGIPAGVSGYGSTEAAGLTHSWRWKATDAKPDELSEGVSHYGGEARDDIEWAIASDGELRVRGKAPGTIFSGYWRNDRLDPATDTEGWFHTGDLARSDERGNLVFIERRSESIRVRGEFVPIDYVEGQFRGLAGVSDVALWKDAGPSADDVSVLYVVGDEFSVEAIATVAATLPRFMRPSIVVQIGAIPRDEAAGKVRRRLLASVHRVNTWALATMSNRAGS